MTSVKPEHIKAALRAIEDMEDPIRLKQMMKNAEDKGIGEVRDAAFIKLVNVLPEEKGEPFVFDAWKSIHALEEMETHDRGKTVRLSRTRQKIGRDGVRKTLADLAGATQSTKGFDMLIDRDLPELTFEAILLKHPGEFDEVTKTKAAERLRSANVDVDRLIAGMKG